MIRGLVLVALLLGVLAYAVQGGEYGTTDLLDQRTRKRALLAAIDSLEHQVDSLAKLEKRLTSDAGLQERVAREEFGMVRGDRELLYRFAEPRAARDSADVRRP